MRAAVAVVMLLASSARAQQAPEPQPPQPAPEMPPAQETPAKEEPKPEPAKPAPPPDASAPGAPVDPLAKPVTFGAPDTRHSPDRGFRFGSYGRAIAGTDLRGGRPEKILVVAHGPRIVEDSYLELEFSYGFERELKFAEGVERYLLVRPVITIAFDATLFHDTGEFDAHPAIRNMFLDGRLGHDLTLWVGSRMYRGDDIYLFDYWPLDDQNTLGAGVKYEPKLFADEPHKLEVAAHVGFNRLNKPFQFQEIDVPNPAQGATTVVQLNRQRIVASASAAYVMMPKQEGGLGAKVKLHGEVHSLGAGTFKRDDGTFQDLPSDGGVLVGAQVGVFGMSKNAAFRRHLNLFARYAQGLAAFDELAPPTSFGNDLKTNRANELTFGLSGNWDHELGNLMIAALSRRFVDADEDTVDADDGWEYAIDARPLFRVIPDWFVGGDLSYQARFPRGLNAITLIAEDPAVFQIAPIVAWSPMGPSSYDRPQIRFVYRAAHLNQAALDQYVPDDQRHGHPWVHFLGFEAEWWFNSSTYH